MNNNQLKFLDGGSHMGALMRSFDWSQTNLGPAEEWPDSLKLAVSISLNSGFPIAIYWGKQFTLLYNDAWSTIPGRKHPWALGKPGAEVWPEIWDGLIDQFESVLSTGESIRKPDALLLMHRFGYTEECYFDYTLSPIVDVDGSVGGVFNAVIEVSYRVINDRRAKILQLFSDRLYTVRSEQEALESLNNIAESGKADIPFYLLFTTRSETIRTATLTASMGLQDPGIRFSLPEAIVPEHQPVHVEDIGKILTQPVHDAYGEPVREAMVIPLTKGEAKIKGYILIGASSRKAIDDDYAEFLQNFSVNTGTLLNNAYAFEMSEAFEREQVLNEELSSINEELTSTIEELNQTQEKLNQLNNELEHKVKERTAEVSAAKIRVEHERDKLNRFLMEAPAGICVLAGEKLVFELVNNDYQQLLPGRMLLGKPIEEALPEIKSQPVWQILQNVYHTGKTFEGHELPVLLASGDGSITEERYFNFIYQARFNDKQQVDGILVFCFDVTDTVKSKLRIKESETNFRNLVLTSRYPLLILSGTDFVVQVANQPLADLWNKELEHITGKKLLDILPELADQPFPVLLRKVYDTGISYRQEEEVLKILEQDGSVTEKYISFSYDPFLDADGAVTGIVVAAVDITEMVNVRRQLEDSYEEQQTLNEEISSANEELAASNEELQTLNEELYMTQQMLEQHVQGLSESEQRFKNLIRNATVGIILLIGEEMKVSVVNETYCQLIAKRPGEIDGQFLFDVIPEAEAHFRPILDKVRTSGEPLYLYDHPYFYYTNEEKIDGFLNIIYQPYREYDGSISGVMVLCQDVTEQVRAKQRIAENEKRFSFMLNAIPQQVWTATPAGGLNYVNSVVCTDFGYEAEAVVGMGWQKFIHPEDLPACLKRWEGALNSGSEYVTEFRLLMANGEYRWHLSRALPYVEDGQISLWLGTNTDIELQKNNEQKKDEFLSIASHELKTPLTSIKAFNQLMKRTRETEKMFGFIEKSGDHIFRLEKLINDLLDVTKINAGKLTYNIQPFNFSKMLMNSIEGVQYMAPHHEVTLESAPDIMYTGDEHRLEQVLHNFLTNAIKYSPNGKRVIVKCQIHPEELVVSVQDFGIGIAQEHLDKLFDRYYRVDNTAMRFEGLGLGLFISSVILHRHNGSFWIESVQGQGSTFYFKLPLYSDEQSGNNNNVIAEIN